MELADRRMIEELLATHARISGVHSARTRRSVRPAGNAEGNQAANPAGKMSSRCPKVKRCRCGACPRCAEEARWDRIFNERFADPDYYKDRPTQFGSSLGWLGRSPS